MGYGEVAEIVYLFIGLCRTVYSCFLERFFGFGMLFVKKYEGFWEGVRV